MENWRVGDWDETQNGAHVVRRKGCAMKNQGITWLISLHLWLRPESSIKRRLRPKDLENGKAFLSVVDERKNVEGP